MKGKRTRFAFIIIILTLLVLLYCYSKPFLSWMVLILVAFAIAMAIIIKIEARNIELEFNVSNGARAEKELPVTIKVNRFGRFIAAKYIIVELEVYSKMFGVTEMKNLVLPLKEDGQTFQFDLMMNLCGGVRFKCVNVQVWDLLNVFCAKVKPFEEARTVIYPKTINLDLSLSRTSIGSSKAEGLTQNRKGNDFSEIFDIRDYVPGDDIRSVHWKLSCKTDNLIVRQPSDPSHYDVMLLADLGLKQGEREVSKTELNAAVALTIACAEQLINQRIMFCFAIPTNKGLQLYEIRDIREFYQILPEWFSIQIQETSGVGIQCFSVDHLEKYFSRLLVVSSGEYAHKLSGLEKQISVTVISSADTDKEIYTSLGDRSEAVVIPASSKDNSEFSIIC